MNPYGLAALMLLAAFGGAFFTLWTVHVCRSGASPIPTIPKINVFGRNNGKAPIDDDDDPVAPIRRTGP